MDESPTKPCRTFSAIQQLLMAFVVFVVVFLVFVFICWNSVAQGPSDELMQSLIGKSDTEVEAAIGPLYDVYHNISQEFWFYSWGSKHGFVLIKDGKCIAAHPPYPPLPKGD